MSEQKFPKGFYWGASTASHQVEGGTHNQWSVWEQQVAAEQARTAQQRLGHLPNWSQIQPLAEDPNNYISGEGVDHYNRYEEDFDILGQLNLTAFRFSVEWARIEPREGEWDTAAIEHYKAYIQSLKARGIEPFLNIWHWTNPVWFEQKGGFLDRKNIAYFERFVAKLADELCQDITYVITLNEVTSYLGNSYMDGNWPPQHRSRLEGVKLYYNFSVAHKRAYRVLKRSNPALQIGVAHPLSAVVPARRYSLTDRLSCYLVARWDEWFYGRIRGYQDFLGFNFYFTGHIKNMKQINPTTPVNDLGWYMEPYRVYDVLMRLHKRFKLPIFITESGVADMHDQYREWWLKETIRAMQDALGKGVDLRGYFHWSLLDNFEWAYGWWPKFGLVSVNREKGMTRTVRPSAKWLADYLAEQTKQY